MAKHKIEVRVWEDGSWEFVDEPTGYRHEENPDWQEVTIKVPEGVEDIDEVVFDQLSEKGLI